MGEMIGLMVLPGIFGLYAGWVTYSKIRIAVLGNHHKYLERQNQKVAITSAQKLRIISFAFLVFLPAAALLFFMAAGSGSSNGIGTGSSVFLIAFLALGWLAAGALRVLGTLFSFSSEEEQQS